MNLDAAVQGRGDAVEHCQRMAFVIRVFQPANDRGRGADQFCELPLAETSLNSQSGYFACDLIVGPSRL